LVYELPLRFGRDAKPNGLLQITLALLVLAGTAQLGRLSLANYANRGYPVGTGRDHFYSYPPIINADGAMLNIIIAAMRQHFGQVETVVAFPESMAVNYHLRNIDPVAYMQFTPDEINIAGLDNILAELASHPPEAVVLSAREMHEYDKDHFGVDDASGKTLVDWVKINYTPLFIDGETTYSPTGHDIDIFIRRDLVHGPATPNPGSVNPSWLNVIR
jgi:hypothetical protein